ncbi:GntR family transcriptional regulator [Carnimonas nigrificans]|uniref:GntR family transcriptional regulator n=1 Tax=Carnimonas nigrificans TaxID=64323 RepID=UPI000471074B|nr:GntR family transcriptional regulator [Carnimonas nigrificans]
MGTSLFSSVNKPVRRGLRDDVHATLLDLLLSRKLAPGERLSIDRIARDLEVSPTPVREALAMLENTHLVTREALKGYRVAPPLPASEIHHLVDARKMLEGTALQLAMPRLAEWLPLLEEAQQRHSAATALIVDADGEISLSTTKKYFAADLAFHMVIMRAAQNPYLIQMYETLGALTHRMLQLANHGPDDAREAHAEHLRILSALQEGNADSARAALIVHLENVQGRAVHDSN